MSTDSTPLQRILARVEANKQQATEHLTGLVIQDEADVHALQQQLEAALDLVNQQAEELAHWRQQTRLADVPDPLRQALAADPKHGIRTVRDLEIDGRPVRSVVIQPQGTVNSQLERDVWIIIVQRVREDRRARTAPA